MYSRCTLQAKTAEETAKAGFSLASTLYHENITVLLSGELGAGKTTFAQGVAKGLGVQATVTSPSFALEQRYEGFTHLDLYRLKEAEADRFLVHSEDARGVRLIEWAERIDRSKIGPHITIHIAEDEGTRMITCDFLDEAVPSDATIGAWMDDVRLPHHIRAHIRAVTAVADSLADTLVQKAVIVRKEALHSAALCHDLLRFVDFPTWTGDSQYQPTDDDRLVWQRVKSLYAPPHENAACHYLRERHFGVIGTIVQSHRGILHDGTDSAKTIEQKLLAYADKRVMFDTIVTLDQRYDDFITRYGNGIESDHAKKWRTVMKRIEAELFPEGPPSLESESHFPCDDGEK